MSSKDAETVPRTSITGNAPSLLPNKISWFFDLRGPSVHVDTACSSGLTALDLACQSILSGSAQAVCLLDQSREGLGCTLDLISSLSCDAADNKCRHWCLELVPS